MKNQQVALLDALLAEGSKRPLHKRAAKSPASVSRRHGEMMNQTTTPIVSAENRRDDRLVVRGDKAEVRIAVEKLAHTVERIGVAEPDTLSRVPQSPSLGVVFRFEYANVAAHPTVRQRTAAKQRPHQQNSCSKFVRQTFVEWAGQTIPRSFWAKAFYESCRARGAPHQAALRALAFKWIRILHRCWVDRVPCDESRYLMALQKRGAPLLKHAARNAV